MTNDGSLDYCVESQPVKLERVQKSFPPTTLIERRIAEMNVVFEQPCSNTLTVPTAEEVTQFHAIIVDEANELLDCICPETGEVNVVAYADTLGDLRVFLENRARMNGLPLDKIVHLIIDSQQSKLVDGKPVPGELPGKFGKGPNFQPPEKAIYDLLFGYKMDEPKEDPVQTLDRLRKYFSDLIIEHAANAEFNPESQAATTISANVLTVLDD